MLILCLFLSALPTQALAYVGDIQPVGSNAVKQTKLSSGSLALQNDYIRVIARKDGTLSTAPATESADPIDRQTPYCYFVTYGSRHITHPASLRLKSLTFVNRTLNGGGAGFKDLAATVNGDYFAIPPLKLSGAVKYRHLRWQRRHALCGHHAQHRSEAGIPAQRLPHQQLPLRRLVHCGQRRPAAVERPAVRQRLRLGVCRLPPAEAAARMTGQLA